VSALRNGPDRPLAQWRAHENSIYDIAWAKVRDRTCQHSALLYASQLPGRLTHVSTRAHRHSHACCSCTRFQGALSCTDWHQGLFQ
jgi:hypothetical protein